MKIIDSSNNSNESKGRMLKKMAAVKQAKAINS